MLTHARFVLGARRRTEGTDACVQPHIELQCGHQRPVQNRQQRCRYMFRSDQPTEFSRLSDGR